jgi:hypothetical protein
VRQKIVHKLYIQTDQNLPKNGFLPTTDKYSAVFTEYSVAEYSAGHYSAEYSADRIAGRSLVVMVGDDVMGVVAQVSGNFMQQNSV